jgi:transglutaminase-like putative cysteine protease
VVALVLLVAAYAVAVTLDSPGAELLWGVILLALVAAWLWGPRLPGGARRVTAAASVAVAGLLALPVASGIAPAQPWWDYEHWSWFGSEREVTFDWNHSYGPLNWPQRGTTLLEVHSDQPLYWKASVLDRFDGFTWQRARDSDIYAVREQQARGSIPGKGVIRHHQSWLVQASFDVRALTSPFVIGAGTTQVVQGLDGASPSADGTVRKFGSQLAAGDEYSIVTYAPDPTVEELRAASAGYPRKLRGQVLLGLPVPGPAAASAEDQVALGSLDPVPGRPMALWGARDARARAAALRSAYAGAYLLAHRLVADARTPYDATIAVQRYLHRNYTYNPDVPRAAYPLNSFLFDRREGYCQQFSGAMALMLRMVGIPSRVVSGFAPGTIDAEGKVYTVHDTDAHSWVEVYFRGIGWVTFDPTPAAAPAVSQSLNELAAFRGVDPARGRAQALDRQRRGRGAVTPTTQASGGGGLPWGAFGLALLTGAALAACLYAAASWRRRRAFTHGAAADAQLEELLGALARLGWGLPPQATLLALERRFASAGRPAVAGYAAGLRAHRFAPGDPPPPGPAERRALRRALTGGGSPARRLRGLLAIPLGGPRRARRG